jgi:hypothetical protein
MGAGNLGAIARLGAAVPFAGNTTGVRTWVHRDGFQELLHGLELIDHALDDGQAFFPKFALGRVKAKWRQQLRVVLGAAGFEQI